MLFKIVMVRKFYLLIVACIMVSFGTSSSFLNFYEQCVDNLWNYAVRFSVLSINNPCQKIYACHLAACSLRIFWDLGIHFRFRFLQPN
jgi:hypothetical protein